MGRVLTNNIGLIHCQESALGTAGTSWVVDEPNTVKAFGATIKTVARSPISTYRQRRKGTVVDLDSSVEIEVDATLGSVQQWAEGFLFATATNADLDLPVTAVDTTGDTYTVAALSSSQAQRLTFSAAHYATLVNAVSFSNGANNGLMELDTATSAGVTSIAVTANLVTEASPPANAMLQLAGVRFLAASTDLSYAYDGTAKTLTITESGIVGFNWATFGLTVGQFVHVGSLTAAGAVQNALNHDTADDAYGLARVKALTATALTLDKCAAKLRADATPTSSTKLDILFGKFVRNVAVGAAAYSSRSYHFEMSLPNLDTGGATMYQYSAGNTCDALSVNMPLTDKATLGVGFKGTDTPAPVAAGSRKTGADSAKSQSMTAALNTTSDIARLRITDVDETGLTTDFKSLTVTIGNNVSPEKVLGTLGAKYMNTGNFEVDVDAKLLFTGADVVTRIRENTTVAMDWALANDEGVVVFDIPSMTLGGGGREFPVNESVIINTTGQAFGDPTLGYSLGVSIFPVPLPVEA